MSLYLLGIFLLLYSLLAGMIFVSYRLRNIPVRLFEGLPTSIPMQLAFLGTIASAGLLAITQHVYWAPLAIVCGIVTSILVKRDVTAGEHARWEATIDKLGDNSWVLLQPPLSKIPPTATSSSVFDAYDITNGTFIGTLTREQLQVLIDSEVGKPYKGNDFFFAMPENIEYLAHKGADHQLASMLETHLQKSGEFTLRWVIGDSGD